MSATPQTITEPIERTPTVTTTATPELKPGTAAWHAVISASKVSALLGLSSYDSALTLYLKAKGKIPSDAGNANTERGNYLEPAVLAWFADRHPELKLTGTRTIRHPDNPLWTATPDDEAETGELVEVKTSAADWEWGKPGTAEIPPGYLVQILWQMFCSGARIVYLPMLTSRLELREYVVRWEDVEADLPLVLEAVDAYQWCLANDMPPAWDGADVTWRAVKDSTPGIVKDKDGAQLTEGTATEFVAALKGLDEATERLNLARCQILAEIGDKSKGVLNGKTIAMRQSDGRGGVKLVKGRNL